MTCGAASVPASPLASLVERCRSRAIPLIVDLGCFELTRDFNIYNPHLGLHERARVAREWEAFGRSLSPLSDPQDNTYFPPGAYEALFKSTKELRNLARRIQRHHHTAKFPGQVELKSTNSVSEEGFRQLEHDARMAYRVWNGLRRAVYRRTVPTSLGSSLAGSYESTRLALAPTIFSAFDRAGVTKPQFQDRLEGMVTGALTFGQSSPNTLVYVVTQSRIVPQIFEHVYQASEGVFHRSVSPRVRVMVFQNGSLPDKSYFSYHSQEEEEFSDEHALCLKA